MMHDNLTQHIIFCPPPWFVHDEGKRVCVCVEVLVQACVLDCHYMTLLWHELITEQHFCQ